MKLAFHTSVFQGYSLEDALARVRDLGFSYVEIAANVSETPHFAAHQADPKQIDRLGVLLERFELQPAAIDIGGWDPPLCLAQLDEAPRTRAVEHVKRAIASAGALGCSLVTTHLWGLPESRDPSSVSALCEAARRSANDIAPVLNENGVQLNLMPHPGGILEESDATVDLIREMGCPKIGYTYGIGHTYAIAQPHQGAEDMIAYAGHTLTHVLVSDTYRVERVIAPPEVKAHLHLTPGRGEIDFPSVLSALTHVEYSGFLSVHIISEKDRPLEAGRETRMYLESLLRARPAG